ncbi:transcription repressor OFP7-like [Andrographis paniculata]|uniref:transcription repressor OFP7-like n=1 Tax=Andrographis paniculata TaxID=175694 RepID=UPI0021E6E8C0|nr:transcription repressor OFP7-like [Andrographis paniculata]
MRSFHSTTMAKRFRLRISRAISTTLQSCRSKHPSILPQDPAPSFTIAAPSSPEFKWRREHNWHVIARIYENHPPPPHRKTPDFNAAAPSPPPPPPPPSGEKKKSRGKRNRKKINVPTRLRLSTSSADSGWFSSEGGCGGGAAAAAEQSLQEEAETLFSPSISFSTDSSSDRRKNFAQPFAGKFPHRRYKKRDSKRTAARSTASGGAAAAVEADIPARLSVFKKLIPCTVDGKVKESYAIVKRSENPYEDFRNSMADMILEKQMFDPADLEQLLQCFLSLNSGNYHGIIVEAFSDIWSAIFAPSECSKRSSDQSRRRVSKTASF